MSWDTLKRVLACLSVCVIHILTTPSVAQALPVLQGASAAAAETIAQRAAAAPFYYNCTFSITGFGSATSSKEAPPQSGIKSASLSCSSIPSGVPPATVGYNSTHLGAFASNFTGVVATPSSDCQRNAGQLVDGSFKPLHALLYFCGGPLINVRLLQPIVQGVWLDVAPADAKPGWDSALVYFGGSAEIEVEDGRFEHNHAGWPLLLSGSTRMNISSTGISGNHQGGLALQANSSVSMHSSNITHNRADFGASVYAMGSSTITLLHGTLIANNTAENKGGGVYAKDAASVVCQSGSAVDGNQAWQDGAGLFLENSARALLSSCTVSHNSATGTSGGGMMASDSSSVVLEACEVAGNQAAKQGGAVALQAASDRCKANGVFVCRPSLHMSLTNVSNNSAATQGGGLYVGPGALAVVSRSRLSGNKARNGGGVHVRGNTASLHAAELTVQRGTVIAGNAAENAGGINVYGDDGDVSKCMASVVSSELVANTASQGGGGIVANARCSAMMEHTNMHNNSAVKAGGAFSVAGAVLWSMLGVQLSHNTAQMAGAGYVCDNASVLISGSSLVAGNRASHDGGAFALADTAKLQLFGGVALAGNEAGVSGGGVAAMDGATVILNASDCYNNSAEANGGCVYLLDQAQASFANGSHCTSNIARASGGCLCAMGNSRVHVSPNAHVTTNRARVGGGVALLDSGPDNTAASFGSVVTNNTATDSGDDVYVDLVNVTLVVQSIASNVDGMLTAVQLQQQGRVVAYVSRSSGPGLTVSLSVMSNGSSAGSGVRVEASVLSSSSGTLAYYSTAITDASGLVVFGSIGPQLAPGTHTLVLAHQTVSGTPVHELFNLAVRACVRGEVNHGSSTVCDVCSRGSYSLGTTAEDSVKCQYDVCDRAANCSQGGALLLPLPGMYQRSPSYANFQRCPNQHACENNVTTLLPLHPFQPDVNNTASSSSSSSSSSRQNTSSSYAPANNSSANVGAYIAAQCREGYAGVLCATCAPDYCTSRQFTCRRCLQWQSLAAVYAVGAALLLLLIRLMVHFSTSSDSAVLQEWADAARGTAAAGHQLPLSAAPAALSNGRNTATALPSSVLRVLVLYMQYMLVIAGLQVSWPASLAVPVAALASLWSGTTENALALECFLPQHQHYHASWSGENLPVDNSTNNLSSADGYATGSPNTSSSMPLGVLQALVFVCVPVGFFILIVLLEWLSRGAALQLRSCWRLSGCWQVCRLHNKQGKHTDADVADATLWHAGSSGGSKPGVADWHHAQQLQQAPAEGRAEHSTIELAPAGCIESAVPSGQLQESAPVTRSAAVYSGLAGGSASHAVQQRARPNAVWCGVLFMVIVFFFLTNLAKVALSMFACIELQGDGTGQLPTLQLWLLDVSVQCGSPVHTRWKLGLGVPLVVLLFGVLPVAVAVLLWSVRRRLTEPEVQRHIGFLYLHYRPQVFWWQVVEVVQTLWLAVAASTSHRTGPFFSTLLANAVLALILLMLMWFKPMASRQVQLLAHASLGCQLLTTYAALAFLPLEFDSGASAAAGAWLVSSSAFSIYREVLGAVVLAVNAAFIVWLVVVLLRTLPRTQMQAQWQRVLLVGSYARASFMQQLGYARELGTTQAA